MQNKDTSYTIGETGQINALTEAEEKKAEVPNEQANADNANFYWNKLDGFMNDLYKELLNVLSEASITPNPAVFTQIRNSIKTIIDNRDAIGSFKAYLSNPQTISTSTDTVVELDSESHDNNGWFDTATHKYTPQKAGKYIFNCAIEIATLPIDKQLKVGIAKNGVTFSEAIFDQFQTCAKTDFFTGVTGGVEIEMNGITDYIVLLAWQDEGIDGVIDASESRAFLSGHYIGK